MSEEKKKRARGLLPALAVSWGAHFVLVASGFIIPRLIDDTLGQDLLGMWDLAWALVSYCALLEMGLSGSVNRHVALYRRKNDLAALNRMLSSVALVQRVLAGGVSVLAFLLLWGIGKLFADQPELASQGGFAVALLAWGLAITFYGSIYNGIITGCNRWVLHHSIFVFTNTAAFVGMLVLCLSGNCSLPGLAGIYVAAELAGVVIRGVLARKVCTGMQISAKHFRWTTTTEMMKFGGKALLGPVSTVVLNQSVNVMIAASLGPGILALFARPRSLVSKAAVLSQKYANMLVPTSAAIDAKEDGRDLQNLVQIGTRMCLFIALPLVVALSVSGGPIMHLWMGENYVRPVLISVLAIGFLAEVAGQPLNRILVGRNLHGRPALFAGIGAIVSLTTVGLALLFGVTDLVSLALFVVVPWTIAHGLIIPRYGCKALGMSYSSLLRQCWRLPILCCIPFAVSLWLCNRGFSGDPAMQLLSGFLTGGLVLAICYYFAAVPASWKRRALLYLRRNAA